MPKRSYMLELLDYLVFEPHRSILEPHECVEPSYEPSRRLVPASLPIPLPRPSTDCVARPYRVTSGRQTEVPEHPRRAPWLCHPASLTIPLLPVIRPHPF